MASFQEYRRLALIPATAVVLAGYYLLVYVPLARRAEHLDAPLARAWRTLADSLGETNATALDLPRLAGQVAETRQALATLEGARKQMVTRLQLDRALLAKLNAPFQLVDYQNARSKEIDDLGQKAKQQQVAIDPAVLAGFPEHTADTPEPAILWPALALTEDLVATAIRCKVTAIHSLEVPLSATNLPVPEASGRWDEIPIQIEFTASADSATRLIQSLPMKALEVQAAGLPVAPPEKPPLFLERLIIRKQTPEKEDEVRVWLRAVGFVHRE